MLQPAKEFTPEELDAMEAQAAAGAAGQPFSVVDTSAPSPAMGPLAQLDPSREYTPEELDLYENSISFLPEDLDKKLVETVFDNPTYIPSREEYFEAKDTKARLKSEGKLPGLLENAATAGGAFIQTLGDMAHEIVDDPGEFLARSPATMLATVRKSWRNTNDVTRWIRKAGASEPLGRYEDTGEFVYGQAGAGMPDADVLAGKQMLALEQGRKIRPVNDEDLKDAEYDLFLRERERQKELEEWVASTTAPTEFVTRMLTGRNQMEQPMQATSDVVGGLVEATNVATMGVPLAAGANTLGISRLAKAAGSRGARIIERAAGDTADGFEAGATRLQGIIQRGTRISPENQTKLAKWAAAGGVGGAVLGVDTDVPILSQTQDAAKILGGAYLAYKGGVGTLRTVQKVAGPTSVALRIAADPADGLDHIAQASVATKLNAFPDLAPVREALENPTRFRAIESTPARIAADPRFGAQTRAVADALSNPLVVQGVRGASAVAGGAIKGAAANAPFVGLALNAEEDQAAGAMLGIGGAFGAAGGAASRVGGVRQRRAEARVSDIGRMLIDVELAGGDVAGLAKTYSPQQLGDLAAMQGVFRDKVDFMPLNKTDFDLNTQANGGAGAAGLFVQAPAGEKARVFINLDAKREGIAPHEFGHALLKSGALGGAQADAIRAHTTRRYTQAGVEARAREYATTMIANENAAAFPGQNLPISEDAIRAKMDELGQSGLLRGDADPLDWARDELFAEDFRQASANLDFASIRRGLPADGSWLGTMEGILGGTARALSISGVRIDPATGAPIDTPATLFRTNPILATDKVLVKNLDTYIRNYRQWVTHPDQTKARGVRVAPAARPQDLANNPQVTFHDLGGGVRGNEFATIDPATGQPMLRNQADINAQTATRQQQMRTLVGSKLQPPTNPALAPKKTADGRVTIRGRVLPQQFDFLNGFAQHQRGFARQFETAAANGEAMMVRYHSIGSGDTGSFRVKNLGNLEAITREVIPWGWELTGKGNLLASVLDLTQFRNRAIRAINEGNPQMQNLFGNDMAQVESALKQWMDNHRQDLPGSNKIGEQKRDAINALVGIATNMNKGANPFSGKIGGPGSAIKQFRLDRVDTAAGTGRQGFHFDYDKANGNQLPEVPTPLPDLSRDLPTPRGQAMPDVAITPEEARRQGLAGPFYHGSPDFQGTKFDRSMLARSSGLSRGGFSFTDDAISAESYAKTKVDSAQAAVDSANKVMRELGNRMDAGLKVKGFEDASELPQFNTRFVDDISELAGYFDDLANDIPKDLGDRLRSAGTAINAKPNPMVIQAYLRNPKQMEVGGRKLWVAENPEDIFVSKATPLPSGQAMPDVVPEFDPQAGAFVIDRGDDVSLPVYQQANRGKPAVDNKGEPKFVQASYDLITAPRIAEYSGPGPEDISKPDFKKFAYDITQKGQQQINTAIDSGAVDSAANSVVKFTQEVMQTPDIAAGMGWYSRMRENLLNVLGEDGREILSQLLGATSAKTPVDENFLQAMDAYEGIKAGRYDANRKAYLEMLASEEKGELTDIILRRNYTGKVRTMADQLSKEARQMKGKKKALTLAEAKKLRDLVKKSPDDWTMKDRYAIVDLAVGIMPKRSNGKKFNANSMAVLKVISGKWLDNRDSPKTPNFAGNLSGRTVQATIDVWAARFLRETLYADTGKPWRIQPKSEGAVNNQDFALGQVIMARAAKKLDMNPDDLQAVLWFAEKHRWDNRGWTKNQGAEKSSFDTVFNVFFPKDGKPLTFAEASKIFKKSKK